MQNKPDKTSTAANETLKIESKIQQTDSVKRKNPDEVSIT